MWLSLRCAAYVLLSSFLIEAVSAVSVTDKQQVSEPKPGRSRTFRKEVGTRDSSSLLQSARGGDRGGRQDAEDYEVAETAEAMFDMRAGAEASGGAGVVALQELLKARADQKGTKDKKLAFVVTLLDWNPHSTDYVEILRNSLAAVAKPHSKYKTGIAKFVALVPDHLKDYEACLLKVGFDEVLVTPATNLCPNVDNAFHTWLYTRVNLWNMTQYDRIVAMDSDQLVLQNIDELFEYNTFAAPNDWPRGALGTVANKYKCACKSKMCRGKVEGMQGGYEWIKQDHYLNTGLMLIQPNHEEYKKMVVSLMEWNLKRFQDVYDPDSCQPSEQRFVGDYFYVGNGGDGWFPLPAEIYNVRLLLVQGAPQLLTSPKILHYAGFKPTDHKTPSEPIEEWYWQEWLSRQRSLKRAQLPDMCKVASKEPRRLAVEPAERMGLMSASQKHQRNQRCGEPLLEGLVFDAFDN